MLGPGSDELESILVALPGQFRSFLEAQRRLLEEWRDDRADTRIAEFLERLATVAEAGGLFRDSYMRIRADFPQAADEVHAMLLPIEREYRGR